MQKYILLFFFCIASSAQAQILYVGDSHSAGAFGDELSSDLKTWLNPPAEVDRYAVGGSTAKTWEQSEVCTSKATCPYKIGYVTPNHPLGNGKDEPRGVPGFEELLKKHSYSAVVIALGTNDANASCSVSSRQKLDENKAASINKMLDQVKGKNCVWVGPPSYTKGPLMNACKGPKQYQDWVSALKATVESHGCHFVANTTEPSKSLHYAPSEAKLAAKKVASEILKIKANPTSDTSRGSPSEVTR